MNGKQINGNDLIDQYNTRIGLLSAENKRLKKIVMKYERKLAKNFDKNPKSDYNAMALEREIKRLRKLCSERLGEVEHWKQEYAILSEEMENPDQCEIVKSKIKQEVAKLIKGFRKEAMQLHGENEELVTKNEMLKQKLMRYETAVGFRKNEENEALERRYETIVRKLEMERGELEDVIERMQMKMSSMLTKDYHYRQLRELEENLLEKFKLSGASDRKRSELERKVLVLQCDNERLAKMNRQIVKAQQERDERVEDKAKRQIEEEAQEKLEDLEVKINELILENDKLIEENKELIDKNDFLETEIVKYRRTKYSVSESQNMERDSGEMESLNFKIEELTKENNSLKDELKELTINMKSLQIRQIEVEEKRMDEKLISEAINNLNKVSRDVQTSPTKVIVKASFSGQEMKEIKPNKDQNKSRLTLVKSGSTQALKECYKLVDKLQVENKMLYSRIKVLEEDNIKRSTENQRLYDIIENKIYLRREVEKERDELEGRLSEMTKSGHKFRNTMTSDLFNTDRKSLHFNQSNQNFHQNRGNEFVEEDEIAEDNFSHQSFGGYHKGDFLEPSEDNRAKGSKVEILSHSEDTKKDIFSSPEKSRDHVVRTPTRESDKMLAGMKKGGLITPNSSAPDNTRRLGSIDD